MFNTLSNKHRKCPKMTRKKVIRRTIPCSISFEPTLWNKIQFVQNRSEWVQEACKQRLLRETTKEGRMTMLKDKKRVLLKEINDVDKKIMDLEE